MVKKMQETDTENEIREAYRVFDKERTGGIAVSEMRLILSNLPEKLSDEEIGKQIHLFVNKLRSAVCFDLQMRC